MASGDIDQLTEALAKTHVGDELSYKGQGLKLNDKQSGWKCSSTLRFTRDECSSVNLGIAVTGCCLFWL